MGNLMGKAMDSNMEKNQKFMLEMNRTMLERQIHMQNQMRERMVASQIAGAREMFVWLGSFYAIAGTAMLAAFFRTKKPATIAPLLPLTFVVGYQADFAYGSKMNRIKAEAENIIQFERDIIEIPSGLPTVSSIDSARIQLQDEQKYHASSRR
ncbi:plasminogen receptor (KT) [Eurytemora carolleeae]|uniref:plasminogen receptor (KT) n=1 Tax=Eurytemora carolleeae TaxID=1294199 RepID=UPI000C782C51|nr:plasminogen receptor (KT) [Eurytemora carolleeae]|eukprot:XP_023344503.1 plasminogen receptor (KT)-like [Eurytemora affinis]